MTQRANVEGAVGTVPFLDLRAQHAALQPEIDRAIRETIARGDFVLGQAVTDFETAFAEHVGAEHAIGVGSCSDALHLALRAWGIGPGDEVITVANTFVATVFAIDHVGATPVLVDCDPDSALIDVAAVERAITDRTRAIVPVHLYGQPAHMSRILDLAETHGLRVLEDVAQAVGARAEGRPCGSLGHAAAFSFYPGKNLGAFGDAGAITTNDADVAATLRRLRNLGSVQKYHHEIRGFNSRLDTLQAAVLGVKLPHVEHWNARRREAAGWYRERLRDAAGIACLAEAAWTTRHTYHLFVVRLPGVDRDAVAAALAECGITTIVHYPVPVHRQPAFRHLDLGAGSMPVSERLSREILSLPVFPEITRAQVDHVADRLIDVVARAPRSRR